MLDKNLLICFGEYEKLGVTNNHFLPVMLFFLFCHFMLYYNW